MTITEYKKKVKELNESYRERLTKAPNAKNRHFKKYLKELALLDEELVRSIRHEKGIAVWSIIF